MLFVGDWGEHPKGGVALAVVEPFDVFEHRCHTDLTPQNLLHRTDRSAALIDWDMAAPSTRVWELAGAA